MTNERIPEEFSLGHKIEQRPEGKADDGDIRPVLMLGQNDRGAVTRKNLLPLYL
jgi:hypothetical protein